jgi:hypothetical protein
LVSTLADPWRQRLIDVFGDPSGDNLLGNHAA